jgi:hypothetical protein
MTLVDANPYATRGGLERLPGRINYFRGNDPSAWHTNIAAYAKVRYEGIYPGVDVVYYGNPHRLEYDFVVAPGADPRRIALDFEGVDALRITAQGDLVLGSPGEAVVTLHKPFAYQDVHGTRQAIPAGYVLQKKRARLDIGGYDRARPLIIDPVLAYSTRLAGSGQSGAYSIAVDTAGYVYITGDTDSRDFPVARTTQRFLGGGVDIFVAKLSRDGSQLLFVTYLGGREDDVGSALAVDAAGNIYLTGDTSSPDFPVVNPIQPTFGSAPDVFVAKLGADGSQLLYSTYLGGAGGERGMGIGVDSMGNAYVAGYTHSGDFPTVNAFQGAFAGGNADAFIAKVAPNGSALVYSTFFGGGNDRPDIATHLTVDAAGNAFVTGITNSIDFPVVNPLQPFRGPTDVFVAKFNPAGFPLYSTFLGGNADDEGMGIAVDASGSAYITGETESVDFPTTNGAFSASCLSVSTPGPMRQICRGGDAFITKLNPAGSALIYSTYLNGDRFEVGRAIAVDPTGSAYVTGITSSADFPMLDPFQASRGGGKYDAFVVKLNPSGSALAYASYLGGAGDDGGYSIAVDNAGNAYVTGYTISPDFPLWHPLNRGTGPSNRGFKSAFVSKLVDKVPRQ